MAGGGAAPAPEGADDILGLFRRIQEERRKAADAQGSKDSFVSEENDKKKETPVNVLVDITKLFVFSDFSEITRLANTLSAASIRGITICIRMRRRTSIIFWSARADRHRKSSTRCAIFYPNTERSRRIRRQQARS